MRDSTVYRGRFAPSPTGPLHFGSLVAAMGSYLDARTQNGQWLVRIEDIDPPREKKGAADDILRTLEAFGLEWDGEILRQSGRLEIYRDAANELLQRGLAYPCTCSRKEIAADALPGVEGLVYPGYCRTGHHPDRSSSALRVITDSETISFTDRFTGILSQNLEAEVGDFIVRRSDGLAAYQLAVIMDDAFQGITHVVRGADLLLSTPRQIYLQRLFDLSTPLYAHLPLVLDESGKKLSKQSHAQAVERSDPLSALTAAYRFLGQSVPEEPPANVTEFWQWARAHWDSRNIPVAEKSHEEITGIRIDSTVN
jgi:glutamyl-Q tRNA(Asp) synthetase